MLDAFVVLVHEPHRLADFLDDWRLEKTMALILHERPMLFTTYQSL